VVASYRYDPFGNITAQSGTLADANTYRFSSKELHVQSGLYYYGYRFYDPSLQRWMNRDPIEELGGINLYAFVGNSPVSKFDKNGHVAWVPICCLTCTGLGIWDVIEVVQDETCAYGSASERAVCLLNKLVGNDLGACVLEALGGVINGGSLDEAKDKIADCFKCDGWKAARDVAKAISCTCCMGGLASKIRVPAPRLPPSPAPAAL
jgi:RHS repeat-associated protein